jgi:hypothetical protein
MDEGLEPLESDRFLFSGTLSASVFFFSLAIVIPYVCKYKDEIVMWPIDECHATHLRELASEDWPKRGY